MGGKGGGAGGSGSSGVGLARANARLPAAEIQDTRDRAKQLTQELLEVGGLGVNYRVYVGQRGSGGGGLAGDSKHSGPGQAADVGAALGWVTRLRVKVMWANGGLVVVP